MSSGEVVPVNRHSLENLRGIALAWTLSGLLTTLSSAGSTVQVCAYWVGYRGSPEFMVQDLNKSIAHDLVDVCVQPEIQ